MFLESVLLSVCSLLVLYRAAGVRGVCVPGLVTKGAPRLGPCVLFIVRFFTKAVFFHNIRVVVFSS